MTDTDPESSLDRRLRADVTVELARDDAVDASDIHVSAVVDELTERDLGLASKEGLKMPPSFLTQVKDAGNRSSRSATETPPVKPVRPVP